MLSIWLPSISLWLLTMVTPTWPSNVYFQQDNTPNHFVSDWFHRDIEASDLQGVPHSPELDPVEYFVLWQINPKIGSTGSKSHFWRLIQTSSISVWVSLHVRGEVCSKYTYSLLLHCCGPAQSNMSICTRMQHTLTTGQSNLTKSHKRHLYSTIKTWCLYLINFWKSWQTLMKVHYATFNN